MSGLFAVIMAGGSGTRFWPASRAARPKQLLPIGGDEPLLVRTSRRLGDAVPPERQMVITGAGLVDAVRELLPEVPAAQVVGEPAARDTAACVGLASLLVERLDPDATVVAMPADHLIAPEALFRDHLRAAEAALAEHPERVLVFGIAATRAETGYGWLSPGPVLGTYGGQEVVELSAFVEKPPKEKAEALLAEGGHAWNAGLFAFRPGAMRAAVSTHLPELLAGLERIAPRYGEADFEEQLAAVFPGLPKTSIDKGVMEKLSGTLMLPLPVRWDDVGSWSALDRLREADGAGNVTDGEALALEAGGNLLVASADGLVAVKGVDGLIVVHTPDATLVCRRDDDQGVKEIVEELKKRGLSAFL